MSPWKQGDLVCAGKFKWRFSLHGHQLISNSLHAEVSKHYDDNRIYFIKKIFLFKTCMKSDSDLIS